jgi:hypothetical protein
MCIFILGFGIDLKGRGEEDGEKKERRGEVNTIIILL